MLRRIILIILRFLIKLLSSTDIVGQSNIPGKGGCLLTANHLSRLDSVLVFAAIEREDATGLAAKKYQRHPFFKWLVNSVNGIWINRNETDFRALRTARDYLQSGGALGIAPEGTRSETGALIQARTGAAYLADKAGVPIVPISISGTEKAVDQLLHFQRPKVSIRVGKPYTLPPINRRSRANDLLRNSDEIMCRIAALLPSQYRGVYSAHPRLKELLEENINQNP